MIPAIGFIIGFYVITRMLEMQKSSNATGIHIVMSKVTIVVTIICLIDLLLSTKTIPS